MTFDPFDPLGYFFYDEFLEPDMEYHCPYCDTRFGNERVAWSEEDRCQAFACPGLRLLGVVEQ